MNDLSQIRLGLRLALTTLLGVLGVWLDPGDINYRFHTLDDPAGLGLPIWLAAALVALLILHRMEKTRTPWWLFLIWIPALGLACLDFEFIWMHGDMVGVLILLTMGMLFLSVGTWAYGCLRQYRGKRPFFVTPLLALAIAVSALFVLIASGLRRSGDDPGKVSLRRIVFVGFAIVILAGSQINNILHGMMGRPYVELPLWLGSACFWFSLWSAAGCALLYLFNPWPEQPRIGMKPVHSVRYWKRLLIVAVVMWGLLEMLAIMDRGGLGHIIGYALIGFSLTGPLVLLMLMLTPWLAGRWLPKMDDLPPGDGLGPVVTALLMAMPLAPLGAYFWRLRKIFISIFSGTLFDTPFDRNFPGWALDWSFLSTIIWRRTLMTVLGLSFVVVLRWLSDRSTRAGYWAFTVPAVVIWFCLLSFMIGIQSELIKYIHDMGFTVMRIYGLGYGLGYCALMAGFLIWVIKRPRQDMEMPDSF